MPRGIVACGRLVYPEFDSWVYLYCPCGERTFLYGVVSGENLKCFKCGIIYRCEVKVVMTVADPVPDEYQEETDTKRAP